MHENCSNCGTAPATTDGLCPECRRFLEEDAEMIRGSRRGPARQMADVFTVPGRLLIIATIILAACGTYGVIALFIETLPPGSYPLLLFGAPVLLASGLFFFVAAVILTRLGVKIFQDTK